MDFRTLTARRDREALRVVLNRPDRGNAINDVLLAELHSVLDTAERDPDLRAVVLSGSGPVFCSGMDFADAADSNRADDSLASRGGEAFYGLLERFGAIGRVVVSVVDGQVTGGGVGIVAASDFAYASARSTFALPEALWGLLPCCVAPFLVRRTGFQPAYAMALSTLPVPAAEAHRAHLVDEVLDDAEPAVRRLVSRLSRVDGSVIADAKRYFGRVQPLTAETKRAAVTEFGRLMASPAVRERITGFAEHQRMPWEKR